MPTNIIRIQADELKVWSNYIQLITGVFLDESKGYLIEHRLNDLRQGEDCSNFSELYFKVKANNNKSLQRKIIDAITTGETSFFRDHAPFDLLQYKLIPDLIDRRKKLRGSSARIPIRIWSAACSTGQEVYSVAMVIRELLGTTTDFEIKILGTDISDAAITYASRGLFNKIEIERGLTPDRINRYFTRTGELWKIKDEVRALVAFLNLNLLESLFTFTDRFDVVLCRNVAIYFTEENRRRLFDKIARVLDPEGVLIIGSTESIAGYVSRFESKRHIRSVYYQLKPNS
jgi:chemotaxis protein methyltransferase CheR